MKISNNSQVMCNNNQASFGMAMLKPRSEDMEYFVRVIGANRKGIAGALSRRGFKQLVDEIKDVKKFNVDFIRDGQEYTFRVMDGEEVFFSRSKGSENVIKSRIMKGDEELAALKGKKGVKAFIQRILASGKILYGMFETLTYNPKNCLPKELLTVAEKSKTLQKAFDEEQKEAAKIATAKKKSRQEAQKRLNNAINEVGNILDL